MSIDERHRNPERVVVVGAGAWGTTLAVMLARLGHQVSLLAHSEARAAEIGSFRENRVYLPGVNIPPSVRVTHDARTALIDATLVFVVVPSGEAPSVADELRKRLPDGAIVVSCAKGFHTASLRRLSEVIESSLEGRGHSVCAMSGPNLAREIAAGMPASTVVASRDRVAAERAQRALASSRFRVYTSDDIVGVEYGGALKNVIALAAGAVDGMGAGQNAKAALIARGLAEMTRLGIAAGARAGTFSGLSGLGDLVATCESPLSRNRTFGEALGRGVPVAEASGGSPHVVEGVFAARAAVALAERYGVEMPIASAVCRVLDGAITVSEAVAELMSREFRDEGF